MDSRDLKEIKSTNEPEPIQHLRFYDEASWRKNCQLTSYQGSGAGGQKRNRVYSGQRWIHPCGLQGDCAEYREVKHNTRDALHNLRVEVAFNFYREFQIEIPPNLSAYKQRIDEQNWDYPMFIAFTLGCLFKREGHVSLASKSVGWSTSSLIRQWNRDKRAWTEVQKIREHFGLKKLSVS